MQRLVDLTIEEFGGIHGLHNVGADLSDHSLGRDTTILDTDMDVWLRTLDVNLLGYVCTIRAVLPHLLEQGGGSIVNTSSGAALGTDPLHVAYGASKAAVNHLTRHVAVNWGKQNIRSNGVMPGLVMGEIQERQNDIQLQQAFLMFGKTTRLGKPDDPVRSGTSAADRTYGSSHSASGARPTRGPGLPTRQNVAVTWCGGP